MRSNKFRLLLSTVCLWVALSAFATPSFAFSSGDVPAPVDDVDAGGPGKSHLNSSGVSGFDGNQGNYKLVGNANGRPTEVPPEDGEDGGEGGGEVLLPM